MTTATLPAASTLFAAFQAERVRMGQWAFGAAVRLSDQNRPLGLKLIIECLFLVQALARFVRGAKAPSAGAPAAGAPAATARRTRPHHAVRQLRTTAGTASRVRAIGAGRSVRSARSAIHNACQPRRGWRRPTCAQQKSGFLCMVASDG